MERESASSKLLSREFVRDAIQRNLALVILLYVPLILIIIGLGFTAVLTDNDMGTLIEDPAEVIWYPPWTGAISHTGIFLWGIAGSICVFTAITLWQLTESRRTSLFLGAWGLATIYLMIDDLFQLHEWVIPLYLGLLRERYVFVVYGLAFLALVLLFRHELLRTRFELFVAAIGFFGLSLVFDNQGPALLWNLGLSQNLALNLHNVVEGGLKFLGIVTWFHYFTYTSYSAIREVVPAKATSNVKQAESAHVPEFATR